MSEGQPELNIPNWIPLALIGTDIPETEWEGAKEFGSMKARCSWGFIKLLERGVKI